MGDWMFPNKDYGDVDQKIDKALGIKPSASFSGYTPAQVLKAVYESGLHQYAPSVLGTIWKDGIDITVPSVYLMNFVRKLQGV